MAALIQEGDANALASGDDREDNANTEATPAANPSRIICRVKTVTKKCVIRTNMERFGDFQTSINYNCFLQFQRNERILTVYLDLCSDNRSFNFMQLCLIL